MQRQQLYDVVPLEWKKRRKAGLCPVCGEIPSAIDSRRRVYCSEKCASEWAEKFIWWGELRNKVLEENKNCAKCGISDEIYRKEQKEKEIERAKNLTEKYKDEIEKMKLKKMVEAEQFFIQQLKEIEVMDITTWEMRDFLQKMGEKIPDTFFVGHIEFEVDHIVSIASGGSLGDMRNLQVLCKDCHKNKTKEDMKKIVLDRKNQMVLNDG